MPTLAATRSCRLRLRGSWSHSLALHRMWFPFPGAPGSIQPVEIRTLRHLWQFRPQTYLPGIRSRGNGIPRPSSRLAFLALRALPPQILLYSPDQTNCPCRIERRRRKGRLICTLVHLSAPQKPNFRGVLEHLVSPCENGYCQKCGMVVLHFLRRYRLRVRT